MQLPEYLSTNFPGLRLGAALFYQHPVGIRFELNPQSLETEEADRETVMHRARTLYEHVFSPGDLAFLVSSTTRYETRPGMPYNSSGPWKFRRYKRSVFQLSRKYLLGLPGIAGRQKVITNDGDTIEIRTHRWASISPRNIGYEFILKTISNKRSGVRSPHFRGDIYIINRTKNIIFNMYDHRGLDVIAPTVAPLRDLYQTHGDWILNFDRERIESTFSRPN